MSKKKVALVLGGGSALGFAHIGVIKVLEKYGVNIDIVVGTSIGGLVGAAYCAGVSTETMTKFACKFRKIHFFDVNFNWSGVFSGKGVMKSINKFLSNVKIEELEKQFACVACDLVKEKEVLITSGSLRDAVRSTLSIPGLFVPFYKDDQVLVDGGILNNLPEDIAMKLGADVIISCDVLKYCKIEDRPTSVLETLIYSVNCSTKEIQKLKSYHSDVLLQPNLTGITQMGFVKKDTLRAIKEGEIETEKYIKKILSLLS